MTYVMAYAAAVPTANRDAYQAHAARAAEAFKAHGATRIVESWGVSVPTGDVTSFPLAVKAKEDETVVLGWQEWPDKASCDAGFEKAMQDPAMRNMGDMPFDGKRMIFAGFDMLLDV